MFDLNEVHVMENETYYFDTPGEVEDGDDDDEEDDDVEDLGDEEEEDDDTDDGTED